MSRMLEEIRQQPRAIERTLRSALPEARRLKRHCAARRPRLVVLAARGTSDNAAMFGRYLIEIATGIPVSLAAPSVSTLYGSTLDLAGAMVVGISQSGESTDTNLVLERAREAGAFTIGITNEAASAMARLPDQVFLVRAGREKSVAATKTYTGQLLVLYLIAWALGAPFDVDDLGRIADSATAALKLETTIRARAERYRFMDHALVVGRGLNYPNAFEFALKLMETCYVVAERFSGADLLHGPIAMVGNSFPAFVFAPPGVTWPGQRELLGRLALLKADTMTITDRGNGDAARHKQSIVIPAKLEDLYSPIPYIVPAQLFAACLAEIKGLDPDNPRALSKVTRTM